MGKSGWETTSGLPLDGASVTVVGMQFGFNDHLPGRVCANFVFRTDEGEDYTQSFTFGKNGRASADGSELLDAPAKFPGSSNYGRLIQSAVKLVKDPGTELGPTDEAKTWLGTRWDLGTVPMEVRNPTSGETKQINAFVFTAYHGRGEVKGNVAPQITATAADAASASANPLWDVLVKLAQGSDSHDDFLESALDQYPEAEKDTVLRKAIYQTKPGSVWATAQGS